MHPTTNTASPGLLGSAVQVAYQRSPFYREHLQPLGLDIDTWEELPFTTGTMLLEDRTAFVGAPGTTTYASSGTTDRSKLSFFTPADHESTIRRTVASLMKCGVRPTDAFVVAHGFGIWLIGSDFARAGEALGLRVLPIGKGPGLVHTVDLLRQIGADIVATSPAYAHRLVRAADVAEGPAFGARLLLLSGETVTEAMRRSLLDLWGVGAVHSFYGSAELGHYGCDPRGDGSIEMSPDFACEVIGEDSAPRPLSPGTQGELVLTTLFHQGMPLVRYRTGDLVEVQDCRTEGKRWILSLHVLGRLEESVALEAGEKLWAWQLERALLTDPRVTEFQAVVREVAATTQWLGAHDFVSVKVTSLGDVPLPDDDLRHLEETLRALSLDVSAVAGATVDFEVEWIPSHELRDVLAEGKLRRILDERPLAQL